MVTMYWALAGLAGVILGVVVAFNIPRLCWFLYYRKEEAFAEYQKRMGR